MSASSPSLSSSEDLFVFFRPRPDGHIDPAGEAGWFLQRERERRNQTLETISEITGIHSHHLEALETGDLTGMPARMEALRMVGLYGHYLGFDPEPLVLHYARFLPNTHKTHKRPGMPHPLGSAKIICFDFARRFYHLSAAARGGIVGCLGLGLLAFGVYSIMDPHTTRSLGPQQEAALVLSPTQEGGEEHKTPLILEQDAQNGTEQTASIPSSPSVLQGGNTTLEQSDPLAGFVANDPSDPQGGGEHAPPRLYGAENHGSTVVLTAKGVVWLRIEDSNGHVVFSETLNPGDQYRVPNQPGLVAISRDGGLISYAIEGTDQGVLGQPGEILIGKSLNRDHLKKASS